MEVDEIGEIEKNLVQQLKSLCDGNGKEIDPIKSVSIFLKLAKVYENKTENKERNWIRSAALLNAAIVREPNNLQLNKELQRFCSAVLLKVKARKVDADLVKYTKKVQNKLNKARIKFGKRFNELKQILNNVKGNKLLALEKKKVTDVQNLQNEVSMKYSELMKSVSDNCIEIMGEPPCKYSVAAMGSLARSEVTLYSDMEFIILLENLVAKREDKETILKYFRWFSTIFHIVIINLGETMIPSVAIPSLNWFYDKVTPNGVTFDGMMPHASKIPLGRQPTENKPWKTELIKTVDEMLEYLKPEEILKEGYHLGDMLSKTGYVSGYKRTFDEYNQKSHAVVKSNDKESQFFQLLKQIDEDLQNLDIIFQQSSLFYGDQSFNIKRVIYRSATIFISAIGRIYSIKEPSCFDIIDKLEEDKRCSGIVAHKLRFMVAIACEVRFKVYQLEGRQDDIFMEGSAYKKVVLRLVEFIGKRSLLTFMVTTSMVQTLIKKKVRMSDRLDLNILEDGGWEFGAKLVTLPHLDFNNDLKLEIAKLGSTIQLSDGGIEIYLYAVNRLCEMNEYKLGLDLCRKVRPLCKDVFQVFNTKVNELRCNVELGRYDAREVEAQLVELDELMVSVEAEPPGELRRWAVACDYAECLHELSRFARAVDICERCLHYYEQWEQIADATYVDKKYNKPSLLISYSDSLQAVENYDKAIEVSHKALGLLGGTNRSSMYHMRIYYNLGCGYLGMETYFKSFIYFLETARIASSFDFTHPNIRNYTKTAYEHLLTQDHHNLQLNLDFPLDLD